MIGLGKPDKIDKTRYNDVIIKKTCRLSASKLSSHRTKNYSENFKKKISKKLLLYVNLKNVFYIEFYFSKILKISEKNRKPK
jgi:hypothetical protein